MSRGPTAGRARRFRGAASIALFLLSAAACHEGSSSERSRAGATAKPLAAAELRALAEPIVARTRAVLDQVVQEEPERALRRLGPSPWNGESYRFDERVDEATIEGMQRAPDASEGESVAGFEFDGGDAVAFLSRAGAAKATDGRLSWSYRRPDYLITQGGLAVPSDEVAIIEIRIRAPGVKRVELFWSHQEMTEWSRENRRRGGSVAIDLNPDGEPHTYRIDAATALRRGANVGQVLRTLVLRVLEEEQAEIEIDHVRLLSKRERYAKRPVGRAYETFGREMRSTLYAHAPGAVAYDLRIPETSPTLEFGTALLDEAAAAELSVSVESASGSTEIFAGRRTRGRQWDDARVDLSRWAGQSVRLRFAAKAEPSTVVFWSNPIVYGAPKDRLNVIVLLEDTLRADHLSVYGHPLETSPVKEGLARRGVVFEAALSQATETRPSVVSLMTSLYPTATGVWNFHEVLDDRYLTLAEILRAQGFETASFAQNPNGGAAAGVHQGFSTFRDHSTVGRRARAVYGGKHVAEWLRRHRDRNFLLYLHLVDPHGRYDPPKPFDRFYRELGPGKTLVEPDRLASDPAWVETPTLEGRRLLYDGEVRYNDEQLTRLLEILDELGLSENTLLVFLADHGEHLGEHGLWSHHPPGYVQVLHVPLMMVLPKSLPAGLRVAGPVQLVDVAPTILELAGVDPRALPLEGQSLLPRIRGENGAGEGLALSEEVIVYRSKEDPAIWGSLFVGDRHLLRSEGLGVVGFDRLADPEEKDALAVDSNLADEATRILETVKQTNLAVWRTIRGEAEAPIEYQPERQQRLRALGYLQ